MGELKRRRPLSVLIVEDDPHLASALKRDLSRHGVVAEHVSDGAEAERSLMAGSFDVLLADLQLGTEDGLTLLKQAKALSLSTRTILMSGYASTEERLRAAELGARYLEKPFTPSQFFQVLEQVADVKLRAGLGDLLETLGMLHREGRTALVVVNGPVRGEVCLVDGEITHAARGALVGGEALKDLLAVPHRSLEVRYESTSTRSITSAFAPLVLGALEQLDRRERPINR